MAEKRSRFPVKRLPDGRAMINLGSSAHTAPGWNNLDFSWLVRVGRHRHLSRWLHRCGIISAARYDRIQRMDPDILLWNLAKGIPFADSTFDVVYHSHLLEHLDREIAPIFLRECCRVLKPGGVLRVVVPDLEQLTRNYLNFLDEPASAETRCALALATEEIFDQMVRRRPRIRDQQPLVNRIVEGLLVGNTMRSGTMHRWMYDHVSLGDLLADAGLVSIAQCSASGSQIEGWQEFLLDTDADGGPSRNNTPRSLYMEARRPKEVPEQQPLPAIAPDRKRRAG